MAGTVTVTGTAGPGLDVTAQVFNNVSSLTFDMLTNVITIVQSDPNRTLQISIEEASTVTVTKSGSTYTVAIS